MTRFLSVLALALVAALPANCRADFITPDSISHPRPNNVGSVHGTPISDLSDLVTDQYSRRGVRFGPQVHVENAPFVAITRLDGVNVFAPAVQTEMKPGQVGEIDYSGTIHGTLASVTDYLAVEVIGVSGPLVAFDKFDRQIGFGFVSDKLGPNGGKLLEITSVGIERFQVYGPLSYDPLLTTASVPDGPLPTEPLPLWGLASIATSPGCDSPVDHCPEPSSLLLALFGAAGFTGAAVRSRLRRNRVATPG